MSELIKYRAKKSIGQVVLIFLDNNFRFEGKLTNCDEECLEILDFKTSSYKIFKFDNIKELEVKSNE